MKKKSKITVFTLLYYKKTEKFCKIVFYTVELSIFDQTMG